MRAKILFVDDSEDDQFLISRQLADQHTITRALSLKEAEREIACGKFDIILLDLNLPDGDGMSFMATLRQREESRDIPIILFTHQDELPKELMGFSLGAEDFISKNSPSERIRARIEARLKKVEVKKEQEMTLFKGNLKLNVSFQKASVIFEGKEVQVELTQLEFKLLFYFLRHEDYIFSREQILSSVWGDAAEVFDRTVDMHISKLRKKIAMTDYKIESVHRAGYRLTRVK